MAVHESECIKKYKPDSNVFYSTAIRCEIVKSLRKVDEVITYQAVNDIVRKVDFDVFAVGEDQNHAIYRTPAEFKSIMAKAGLRCLQDGQIFPEGSIHNKFPETRLWSYVFVPEG